MGLLGFTYPIKATGVWCASHVVLGSLPLPKPHGSFF